MSVSTLHTDSAHGVNPADEWASSIEESHPPSDARTAALQVHYAEVDNIRRALSRYDSQIQALTADGAGRAAYGKHLLWF